MMMMMTIIKNKKRTVHTDRCGNTCRQKGHTKGSREETKLQEFIYTDTTHMEQEMYDYTSNNWSHRNSNKRFKENLEPIPEKHSIDSIQKTIILRSHIIQKVLQSET
jgi:protein required for attachment to host cells